MADPTVDYSGLISGDPYYQLAQAQQKYAYQQGLGAYNYSRDFANRQYRENLAKALLGHNTNLQHISDSLAARGMTFSGATGSADNMENTRYKYQTGDLQTALNNYLHGLDANWQNQRTQWAYGLMNAALSAYSRQQAAAIAAANAAPYAGTSGPTSAGTFSTNSTGTEYAPPAPPPGWGAPGVPF